MPASLVERTGEAILLVHIPGLIDALLPREPLCFKDKLGLGGGARAILLCLEGRWKLLPSTQTRRSWARGSQFAARSAS